jgi:hypothetical protein
VDWLTTNDQLPIHQLCWGYSDQLPTSNPNIPPKGYCAPVLLLLFLVNNILQMLNYPPQTLQGNSHGWIDTKIRVFKGDTVQVRASGTIKFGNIPGTNGYPRNPDGRDEKGKTEIAPGMNPATGFIRNSLVLKVGNRILQGGSNTTLVIPENGMLLMCNNDNFVSDNSGAWTVNFSIQPGLRTLRQDILIVIQGKNCIAAEKNSQAIFKQAQQFERFCEGFSGNRLELNIQTRLLEGFTIKHYEAGNFPDFNNANMLSDLRTALQKQGVTMDSYHAFIFIFDQSQNGKAPGYGGLSWAWNKAAAIPWWTDPTKTFANNLLSEYMLHEYLHHMEHYFPKAGVNNFIDIHCWNGINTADPKKTTCKRVYNMVPGFYKSKKPGTMLEFYEGLMKYRDDGTNFYAVDYSKLHGLFGKAY